MSRKIPHLDRVTIRDHGSKVVCLFRSDDGMAVGPSFDASAGEDPYDFWLWLRDKDASLTDLRMLPYGKLRDLVQEWRFARVP